MLAVDSRATRNGAITSSVVKAWHTGDAICVGLGDAFRVFPMKAWLRSGKIGDQPKEGCVVVFSRDGGTIYEDGGWQPVGDAEFYAFGSGDAFAMGAMAMGATAEQAVEVATRFDVYSGGPITVLSL